MASLESGVGEASVTSPGAIPAGVFGAPLTSERFYRPELDWLRFMAFAAVFLLHSFPSEVSKYTVLGLPQLLVDYIIHPLVAAGGYGVDLFFALSAFLITELLLTEKERSGRVHVKSFYVRRVLRIWPLYITFILLVAIYELTVKKFPALYYVSLLGFVGNWYTVITGGVRSLCGHLWSVCIEEQFYIVWPNLVGRMRTKRFAIALLAMFNFGCLYRVFYLMEPLGDTSSNAFYLLWNMIDAICGSPAYNYSVWYNTLTRLDGFALGGLLACILHARPLVLPFTARAMVFGAGLAIYWVLGRTPYGGYYGTLPIWTYPLAAFGSVLCILAFVAAPPRTTLNAPLRVLSYLGKISYGLYVYHLPAVRLAEREIEQGMVADRWVWLARMLFAGIVTLAAAMISYRLLEEPFLRMKRRFTYVESRPE